MANQQATRDWWQLRRTDFRCIASYEVLREVSRGDPEQIRRRLAILQSLTVTQRTSDSDTLIAAFLRTGAFPARAHSDVVHLAVATAARADYMLTWNCRHLANVQILRRVRTEATRLGWELPVVCIPSELMGDFGNEN